MIGGGKNEPRARAVVVMMGTMITVRSRREVSRYTVIRLAAAVVVVVVVMMMMIIIGNEQG